MPSGVSNVWEATRTAYQALARRKGAAVWGEKTHWCEGTLALAEHFSDARFIFLWRDLHDVVGGIARGAVTERFYRKAGFTTRALLGSESLRRACDTLKAQDRAVHELYYEDLAASPSEAMKRVCEFLEVRFEPQMASLDGADRSLIKGVEDQHHSGLWCDRIAVQKEKDELVPPAVKRKIDRYLLRWKRQYRSGGSKYCEHGADSDRVPNLTELWRDRIVYRSLMLWDELVKVTYALAPLTAARFFRSWLDERSLAGASASDGAESPKMMPVLEGSPEPRPN